MKDNRKPEEIAVNRHQIIAPILAAMAEKADAARLVLLKKEACELGGISRRTLGRWLDAYEQHGFDGLKPADRSKNAPSVIPEELITEAILLRREVPSRSIPQIIEILELEGKAPPGLLKRTTLQDKLQAEGYSARQMKLYQSGGIAARRFQRQERGDMWHSDIKFGPFLNANGMTKQIYLVSFLDDATRYVVHGEFYDSLDQTVVEDCFRKAILKEGLPRRVYFDNGKQYRTKWMERACAILGIKLLFAYAMLSVVSYIEGKVIMMGNETNKSNPIAEYLMNVWNRESSEVLNASKKKAMESVMEIRRNSRPYIFPKSSEIPGLSDEDLIFAAMEWMRGKITDWFDPYKDLVSLPKPCQYVYSCQTIIDEIYNGGVVQLVFNSRMKDAEESIAGFIAISAPEMSSIMKSVVGIYHKNEKQIDGYKSIPNGYAALANEGFFAELERLFADAVCSVDISSYIRANIECFGD